MVTKGIAVILICLVGMLFCILLVLSQIAKTLQKNGQSLFTIAKHLERIDEGDGDR